MKTMIVLVMILAMTACSSIGARVGDNSVYYPYVGLEKANSEIKRSWHKPIVPGEVIVRSAIDWPLTLLVDTVVLPVDIVVQQATLGAPK